MADFLKIAQLGTPCLRERSRPVTSVVGNSIIASLGEQMLAITQAQAGVGLAAPQVGVPLRLILVASRPNARYPQAPDLPPTLMINPRLVWAATEQEQDWEGCLSVPGLRGRVWRSRAVIVDYLDREGEPQRQELTGFPARIVQHELDHLDGILFVDRLRSDQDCFTEAEYQQLLQAPDQAPLGEH